MTQSQRPTLMAVMGLAAVGLGAGCVATRVDASTCARAPGTFVEAIQERVGDGTLRNASIKVEGPYTFVSAEMLRPGDDEDTQGELLTFVTGDATDGGGWRAVDHYALEHSAWPRAPFDVTEEGAIDSRGCVSYWWGEEYEPDETVGEEGDPTFCFRGAVDCVEDDGGTAPGDEEE